MSRRFLSVILALCMLLSTSSVVLAADYGDTEEHPASQVIARWTDYGVVEGGGDGNFKPDNQMTRAEAAALFTKLLGLEETADISRFEDVSEERWYYSYIAKCVAKGIMQGAGADTMGPNNVITGETVAVMLVRALGLGEAEVSDLSGRTEISPWARGAAARLESLGVTGLFGSSSPTEKLTRAGVLEIIDNVIVAYGGEDGAVLSPDRPGIVLIVAENAKVVASEDVTVVIDRENASVSLEGTDSKPTVIVNSSGVTLSSVPAGATVIAAEGAQDVTANGTGVPAGEQLEIPAPAAAVVPPYAPAGPEKQEEPEEPAITRADLEKAVVELAWDYFVKGKKLQYGSQELSVFNKYYGGQYRLTEDAAPEYGTSDTTIYSVCSDYVYKVYYEALGYRMFGSQNYLDAVTTAMWLFCEDYDTLLIRWKSEGYSLTEMDKKYGADTWAYSTTDDVREFLRGYEENLRPGDVLLPYGHAMLYIGGGYVLDCWGAKYDVTNGREMFEENGGVSVLHRLEEVFLDGTDPVTKTSYQITDSNTGLNYFVVFRPLDILVDRGSGESPAEDDIKEGTAITESAEIRLAYPAMEIDRTVSITPYGTARTGDELTYSVRVTNRSDTEAYVKFISDTTGEAYSGETYKPFTVTETVPEGTALVKGSVSEGGTVSDGLITWEIEGLAAGSAAELTYAVTVTASSGSITSGGGSVAGIPSNTITNYIGGTKLSKEHRAGLAKFTASDSDKWLENYNISTATSDLDFAERVYAKAMGLSLELPTIEELLQNVFELRAVTNGAKSIRYSGEKTNKVYMLRDTVEPQYEDIRNMLLPGYWGGWYIYFEEQGRTMNEFSIRYLEPGDIIVYADVDGTDPSKVTSSRVMVYAGDGKLVYITSDKAVGSTTEIGTDALIWYAFNPDVFFLLRPSLAFEDVNERGYDPANEPTYDGESGKELGKVTLSEENKAKLAALTAEADWKKRNVEFAVEVYGAIGLDISEKLTKSAGGIYTGVDVLKNLFSDDTSSGTPHLYTPKAKGDLASQNDIVLYSMLVQEYLGGPQMNAADAIETPTVSQLEAGDVLVLAQRTESIYWVGVALGDGRLLMSQYYKNANTDKGIAAEAQIYAILDYSSDKSGYENLLKKDPVTETEWEVYFVLRPYRACTDINEDCAIGEEPEEPEIHEPLSAGNKAKLLAVVSGDEWNKNNAASNNNHANFAINIYRLAGLDIDGAFYKANNNTSCVYMTNALFSSQNASPYYYTLKAEEEVGSDYKPLYKMHLAQYRGGTDMVADGTFSAPKLSDLEAGDILVLVNRTGAYWVGVYVGEGKLAMSKYYTGSGAAAYGKTSGTEYELFTLTEDSLAALLTENPDASACKWQNYMVLRPYLAYEDINLQIIPTVTAEIPLNDAAREAFSALTAEGWTASNTAFALEVYKKIGLDLTDKFGTSNPTAVTLLKYLFDGAASEPYAYALMESAPTATPYDQIYKMVLKDYMGGTYMTKKAENPTLEQLQVGDILLLTNRAKGIYWIGVKIDDGKLLVSEYYSKKVEDTEITAARTTYRIYAAEEYAALLKADTYTKNEWEGFFALRPENAY